MRHMVRLTQTELRAIAEALNARLAGEIDIAGEPGAPRIEHYETALAKVQTRLRGKQ